MSKVCLDRCGLIEYCIQKIKLRQRGLIMDFQLTEAQEFFKKTISDTIGPGDRRKG